MTEKSSNENGHILPRISRVCSRRDYLACTCHYEFISSKGIYMYYRLSEYIKVVVLGEVITEKLSNEPLGK